MLPIIITVIFLLAITGWVVSLHNRLIQLRNKRENSFAEIDVNLHRRHDLIPQLIGAVKGYMDHERATLENVTAARSSAVNAKSVEEKITTEQDLNAALRGLQISIEAYPDLKADSNFRQLQGEISNVENQLASSRSQFNTDTREYNNAIGTFPSNVVASSMGYSEEMMFDLSEKERDIMKKAPEVSFGS
jgi:LemA protein